MTRVAILSVPDQLGEISYLAVSGNKQSQGRTAGAALDGLNAQLGEADSGTLVIVQNLRPDRFFDAAQQQRLAELMAKWRDRRDRAEELSSAEQEELRELSDAEVRASTHRAAAILAEVKA